MGDSADWYLGPGRAGIEEPIVTVEQYRQSAVSQAGGHWSKGLVLGASALICLLLVFLFRGLGLLLFAPMAVLLDRVFRRVRRAPNDVLVVLTDSRVHVLHAQCTLLRGWRVIHSLGSFERGEVFADEVGHFFEIRIALPGSAEPLTLVPAHPSPAAAAISRVVRGPSTMEATAQDRRSPWW